MGSFKGECAVKEHSAYLVETTKDLSYTTKKGITHTVLAGFVTDGASIPKILWSFIGSPFTGLYKKPSLIHDKLYETQKVTRSYADKVFLEGRKDEGVAFWKRRSMYLGVRIGGWKPWNDSKKKLNK